MASKMLRRSGVAVGLVAELLGWKPDWICQVGVGLYHQEIDVFVEEWKLGPEAIVGFEANPVVFKRIIESYPGTLINFAISDKPGMSALSAHPRHKDGSTLKGLDGGSVVGMVDCVTLDDMFSSRTNDLGNCLLWLDCEGSELDVLRGAKDFIGNVRAINVEMTSKPNGDGWADPVDVHAFLESLGFWLQWIHTQRVTAGQYDAIYVRGELFKPEYCCSVHEQIRWRSR